MIAQKLALGAAKNILAGVVLKLVAGEAPLRLMTTIDDGDVWLNFLFQQPGQKLPTPIALVGRQAFWADAEAFLDLLQHAPSCQGLLPEARRRRFYAEDDAVGVVDQVVVIVGRHSRPPLGSPTSVRIGRGYTAGRHRFGGGWILFGF